MTPDPSSFVSHCTVLQAPVLLRNLSDHSVNVSNSVTLHCPARGIHTPGSHGIRTKESCSRCLVRLENVAFWVFILSILYVNRLQMCFFLVGIMFPEEGTLSYRPNYSWRPGSLQPVRPPMREGSAESSAHIWVQSKLLLCPLSQNLRVNLLILICIIITYFKCLWQV